MANLTSAAGDNGVAGTKAAGLPAATVTGSYSGGDFSATETTALRRSVARTQGGGSGLVSEVYSESQGFRTAYSGVEADAPAVTRTP